MSTIVLNSLNYVGEGLLNGISHWWERSVGLVNAFRHLTNRINYGATVTTVAWKLTLPVVKAEDSACGCEGEVVRTTIVDVTARMGRDASPAERADTLAQIQDLVASSQFAASITSLTPQS